MVAKFTPRFISSGSGHIAGVHPTHYAVFTKAPSGGGTRRYSGRRMAEAAFNEAVNLTVADEVSEVVILLQQWHPVLGDYYTYRHFTTFPPAGTAEPTEAEAEAFWTRR